MTLEIRETWARTPDGQPLYIEDSGHGGPVVVCCNGIGVSTFFWKYLREHFGREGRVVTWDYRGHGRSPIADDLSAMTIAQMADDTVTVMDHLGIDEAILVGHSMGCQVILETWRRHPGRVQALVPVLGTYGKPARSFLGLPWFEDVFPIVQPWALRLAGPIGRIKEMLIRGRLAYEFARRTGLISPCMAKVEDMNAYFEHLRRLDMRMFLSLMSDMVVHDTGDILADIDVPTLIIGGERDLFTPLWLSREMQSRIPDSELLIIPDGSHAALIEQPVLINLALADFLVRSDILPPRPGRPRRRPARMAAAAPEATAVAKPKSKAKPRAAAKTKGSADGKASARKPENK